MSDGHADSSLAEHARYDQADRKGCASEGERWLPYLERYRAGEWRARIFRDLILADVQRLGPGLTLLDIGCGRGFDNDRRIQQALAQAAQRYVGVEPDEQMELAPCFAETHRCRLEDAPLQPGSVHLAFAVMVLEHLADPQVFWNKLHELLAENGVFWGFTMDARHWFCRASLWAKRLHIKEAYLRLLHGRRGTERYANYPVYYRANSPAQIAPLTSAFESVEFLNFSCVGQLDHYYPRPLQGLGRLLDRSAQRRQKPGTILAVRLVK